MPFCYKMCLLTCHFKSLKLTYNVCIWQLLEDQCAEESETDKQYDTQYIPICSSYRGNVTLVLPENGCG